MRKRECKARQTGRKERTGVDHTATTMHVVEAEEDLLCNLLYEVLWDALALMALDEAEQVLAEDLEDHADMGTVGAFVAKMVEKGDDMGSPGVSLGRRGCGVRVGWGGTDGGSGGCDEALEELYLVEGGLCVARG